MNSFRRIQIACPKRYLARSACGSASNNKSKKGNNKKKGNSSTAFSRAIRVHELGGPDNMIMENMRMPTIGPKQVLVQNKFVGVNFLDTEIRSGMDFLNQTQMPFTLGIEGSGIITAVGSEVEDATLVPGIAVGYCTAGSYADHIAVDAERAVRLPDHVGFGAAAAIMYQGLAAHYLACTTFPLQTGHTCLVHAAAGGTGQLLTQIAKLRGARVLATCSTEEKAEIARGCGADEVFLYKDRVPQVLHEVRDATDGAGVDVVYDGVGLDTHLLSLNCVKPRGMCVFFGNVSGAVPPIDPLRLAKMGSIFVTRPVFSDYITANGELITRARELMGWLEEGKLTVMIDDIIPFEEAARAHQIIEEGRSHGKILLRLIDRTDELSATL